MQVFFFRVFVQLGGVAVCTSSGSSRVCVCVCVSVQSGVGHLCCRDLVAVDYVWLYSAVKRCVRFSLASVAVSFTMAVWFVLFAGSCYFFILFDCWLVM